MNIQRYRNKLEQEKGRHKALLNSIADKENELKQAKRDLKNTEDAILIAQHVGQQTQNELKYKISELVSLALAAVFEDNPYEFSINFEIKRDKTEANIKFIRNDNEVDPMTATGGGAVDIASFALRIALWNLKRPRSRNTVILDEPFRFLSLDLQHKASLMIKEISDKLKIQFIIISHSEKVTESADKVFETNIKNGITNIKEINYE